MASRDARNLLRRLAEKSDGNDERTTDSTVTDYCETIERATAALDELDAAATFAGDGGLAKLETAVERAEADLSDSAATGRDALETYRAFQAAAREDDAPQGATPRAGGEQS